MTLHRIDALARGVAAAGSRRAFLARAGLALAALAPFRLPAPAGAKKARCRKLGAGCSPKKRCCRGTKCVKRKCACAGGQKRCGTKCISGGACCPGVEQPCHGACIPAGATCCPPGQKACEGTCIPSAGCCKDADCAGPCHTCRSDHTCAPKATGASCGTSGDRWCSASGSCDPVACESVDECPTLPTPTTRTEWCETVVCQNQRCLLDVKPGFPDLPLEFQPVGDCRWYYCTAALAIKYSFTQDDNDAPPPPHECVQTSCHNWEPKIDPVADGTPCSGGTCQNGVCVET